MDIDPAEEYPTHTSGAAVIKRSSIQRDLLFSGFSHNAYIYSFTTYWSLPQHRTLQREKFHVFSFVVRVPAVCLPKTRSKAKAKVKSKPRAKA